MEPALGFEPRTYALQVRSSTPELSWHRIMMRCNISRFLKNTSPVLKKMQYFPETSGRHLKKLQKKFISALLFFNFKVIIRGIRSPACPDVDIVVTQDPSPNEDKGIFTADCGNDHESGTHSE